MINIEYRLENAGWAIGLIGNGQKNVSFDISYLNNSLKELAETAIEINDKNQQFVVFMEEPGEHRLVLNKNLENLIDYELHWYSDWFSWDLVSEEKYELVLKGETTVIEYVNEVRNVLKKIFTEIGEVEYKIKWVNDDFPIKEYEILTQSCQH